MVLSNINGKATGNTPLLVYTNAAASTLKYISKLKASPSMLSMSLWIIKLNVEV